MVFEPYSSDADDTAENQNNGHIDVQKKAAVQIAIDDLWGKYNGNSDSVFEEIWNIYKDNDAAAIKLAEDLEALAYSSDKK